MQVISNPSNLSQFRIAYRRSDGTRTERTFQRTAGGQLAETTPAPQPILQPVEPDGSDAQDNVPPRRIAYISIETDVAAYARGIAPRKSISVCFQRERAGEKTRVRVFQFNPIVGPGISAASVQRARRALKAFSRSQ